MQCQANVPLVAGDRPLPNPYCQIRPCKTRTAKSVLSFLYLICSQVKCLLSLQIPSTRAMSNPIFFILKMLFVLCLQIHYSDSSPIAKVSTDCPDTWFPPMISELCMLTGRARGAVFSDQGNIRTDTKTRHPCSYPDVSTKCRQHNGRLQDSILLTCCNVLFRSCLWALFCVFFSRSGSVDTCKSISVCHIPICRQTVDTFNLFSILESRSLSEDSHFSERCSVF